MNNLDDQMIFFLGPEHFQKIEMFNIDFQPRENIYEEILKQSEGLKPTTYPKLLLAKSRHVDWQWLAGKFESLRMAALSRDVDVLKKHLHSIVPEYMER